MWKTIQPVVDVILFYKHQVTSSNTQTGFPKMIVFFQKNHPRLKGALRCRKHIVLNISYTNGKKRVVRKFEGRIAEVNNARILLVGIAKSHHASIRILKCHWCS